MAAIKGITVQLTQKTKVSADPFNAPIVKRETVDVDDVLVSPSTSTEISDAMSMWGKRAVYTLAIPKGDTHDWEDTTVSFFGQTFRTIGYAYKGIEENIPLRWNAKIMVEKNG